MRANAADQNILQRREATDQMMLLEDHSRSSTMVPQRAAALENRTPAFDDDIALSRLNQPIQASKQRGLACP
jgi:hypothetical protein